MELVLLLVLLSLTLAGIVGGFPIMLVLLAVPLGVSGVGYALGVFDPLLLYAIPSRIFGLLENRLLVSIPFFLVMGKLLEHSGLARDLLLFLAGPFTNSGRMIALATLVIALLLAAASAVVGATVALLASVALPAMLSSGMNRRLASGVSIAGGTLGQIVPPSIVLILLADQISAAHLVSEQAKGNFAPDPVSVGHIFAGGLLPGLLLASIYALYIFFKTAAANEDGIVSRKEVLHVAYTAGKFGKADAFLLVATFVSVPASILFGLASTLEAASIGVLGVLITMGLTRRLSSLVVGLREAVLLTGVIFGIVIGASVLSLVLRGFGGDRLVVGLLTSGEDGGLEFALMGMLLAVFALGFIMEFVEITYIVVPITAPVFFALGVDPIWFAILLAVTLQMSFLTPPMGLALFYFRAVSDLPFREIMVGVLPFLGLQGLALVLVWLFPALATWLPGILL